MKAKVSICVITYNQENYVSQCLDSLLSQKCDFSYEIIIRDDCSTDGTPFLLNQYSNEYPEIINLLESKVNIGANRNLLSVIESARGEYIALCEGDDYWVDVNKLTKQVRLMDEYREVTFTTHACKIEEEGVVVKPRAFAYSDYYYTCQNILDIVGQFAPTASYLFRTESIKQLPHWFESAPVGDFFIEMYMVGVGKGIHLPDVMSVYRLNSIGSWTSSHNKLNIKKLIIHYTEMARHIKKMQKESIFSDFDFSTKISAVYLSLAINHLKIKEYRLFNYSIIQSYRHGARKPFMMSFLYINKKNPRIAYYSLRLREWIGG